MSSDKSIVIESTDSLRHLDVFGVDVQILIDGTANDGSLTTALCVCPPGGGVPMHAHAQFESFYVIEGLISFCVEGQWSAAKAGDRLNVVPDTAHAFRNESDREARFLTISTPAGHDVFFRDADMLSKSGRFSPETAVPLCEKHGIQILPNQ